jgi:hypothetical protein
MLRALFLLAIVGWAVAGNARAQIPPGYELVRITDTPYHESYARLNNHGQIVFLAHLTPDALTHEIFLYDAGQLIRLTDDNFRDGGPDINDDGTIVWSSYSGPAGPYGPTSEIMVYSNGVVSQLTDNAVDDGGPRINNLGHIVWSRRMGSGCGGGVYDVFFYDGQTIRPITTDAIQEGVANGAAWINDHDEIAWTKYDHCVSPWDAKIMLYSNGQTIQVNDPDELQPQGACVNNHGLVGWKARHVPINGKDVAYLWENGQRRLLTDWGGRPFISDIGDIALRRWYPSAGNAQAWLYRSDTWFQLTDDPFNNYVHDIAGNGELTIVSGTYPEGDILHLRRLPRGDLNCDGVLNGADIDPFFLALGSPEAYRTAFPTCDLLLGDVNSDGRVNGADIDPFFDCLAAGGCP